MVVLKPQSHDFTDFNDIHTATPSRSQDQRFRQSLTVCTYLMLAQSESGNLQIGRCLNAAESQCSVSVAFFFSLKE